MKLFVTCIAVLTLAFGGAVKADFVFPFDGDLVSYWSFDDGTANDQAGSNDGTIVGGVSFTGGGADAAPTTNNFDALRFDGVISEVNVPDDPSLDFGPMDGFTISMWFKRESGRPTYHLLGKRIGCSSMNYQLARDVGLLHFNTSRVNAGVDAPFKVWVHIATTYDGAIPATARIYVDGMLKGTVSPHTLGPVNAAVLKIGNSGGCPDFQRFIGVIDEVRIYDRALSEQEIDKLAGQRLAVAIDIKPGSDPNSINPRSKGKIPVAILSTNTAAGESVDFDATQVDSTTIRFGPDGANIAHSNGHVEDVDSDGDADLVLHFESQETGIACGDTEATLTGATFGGVGVTGTDAVNTVGCK